MTTDTPTAAACLNCGTVPAGRYCQLCGQRTGLQRFTFKSLLHEVPHAIFHVDRGLFATLKALTLRPGTTMRAYLDGQRVRYFNPLTLLVLAAGLSALLFSAYPFSFAIDSSALPPEVARKYAEFTRANFRLYSATLIFYLPALSFLTWLSFLGLPATHARSYGEHLVINAYIMGYTTVPMIVMFPLFVALNRTPAFFPVWNAVATGMFIYHGVALYLVFKRAGAAWTTVLRSIVAVLLYFTMLVVVTQAAFWLIYMRS